MPGGKFALQVPGQLIPPESLVTVPVPLPRRVTDSVGSLLKVAVTSWFAVRVSLHMPIPLQPPPDQPAKNDFAAGVAVSVTVVPEAKLALQVG